MDEAVKNEIVIEIDKKWLIRIREDGFHFNREEFPVANADDFARAFMTVLEQNFDVRFLSKHPSFQEIKGMVVSVLSAYEKDISIAEEIKPLSNEGQV